MVNGHLKIGSINSEPAMNWFFKGQSAGQNCV